jgi:hypothetical protein
MCEWVRPYTSRVCFCGKHCDMCLWDTARNTVEQTNVQQYLTMCRFANVKNDIQMHHYMKSNVHNFLTHPYTSLLYLYNFMDYSTGNINGHGGRSGERSRYIIRKIIKCFKYFSIVFFFIF